MPEALFKYMVKAHKLDAQAFAQDLGCPVFVVEPFAELAEKAAIQTFTSSSASSGGQASVAPIRKREGANAFGIMVTIGRATNNDIQINSADISKFHAYVMFDPVSGEASLSDAGSTFGTSVGGQKLEGRGEKLPLSDGVRVQLGSVKLIYLTPTSFREYMLSLAE